MTLQHAEIERAVRSSEPDRVNDVLDQIQELNRNRQHELFDTGFDDLASVYEDSEDGYVRQSVVRVVDSLTSGLSVAFALTEDEATEETREALEQRLDTATGFLLEAIQDQDGRVRQSAVRALRGVYRGHVALEDEETVAALASELESLAEESDDACRDHLLESKADAEHLLGPAGASLIEGVFEAIDVQES